MSLVARASRRCLLCQVAVKRDIAACCFMQPAARPPPLSYRYNALSLLSPIHPPPSVPTLLAAALSLLFHSRRSPSASGIALWAEEEEEEERMVLFLFLATEKLRGGRMVDAPSNRDGSNRFLIGVEFLPFRPSSIQFPGGRLL